MSNRFRRNALILGLVLFSLPAFALAGQASLVITSVTYDPPGADTGHEWVEIENTGPTILDIAGWKLFEGGVHHKIVPLTVSAIPPGAHAAIANSQAFLTDHPSYPGLVFISSFSLKNTGETIVLQDASGTEAASVTYVPKPTPPKTVAPKPAAASKKTEVPAPTPVTEPRDLSRDSRVREAAAVVESAPEHSFGILPWIAGLVAVCTAAVAAILWGKPKEPKSENVSGYTIIEDEP